MAFSWDAAMSPLGPVSSGEVFAAAGCAGALGGEETAAPAARASNPAAHSTRANVNLLGGRCVMASSLEAGRRARKARPACPRLARDKPASSAARIEQVAQRVAHQVEAEHGQEH